MQEIHRNFYFLTILFRLYCSVRLAEAKMNWIFYNANMPKNILNFCTLFLLTQLTMNIIWLLFFLLIQWNPIKIKMRLLVFIFISNILWELDGTVTYYDLILYAPKETSKVVHKMLFFILNLLSFALRLPITYLCSKHKKGPMGWYCIGLCPGIHSSVSDRIFAPWVINISWLVWK